ncbi:MAG: ROK family protein [Bifidobacteriaceae bacterium]|jgi:predicted NBD/HSP70 family sugar kinase|nr:ROK family protein [Bifidobacteriaceae bacterium]
MDHTGHSRTIASAHRSTSSGTNPSRLVRFFYDHPASSRAQAARALGLTPAAVTIITSKLLDAGILVSAAAATASRNGRAVGLKVNASRYKVVGVKFARTLIELGVFDISGTLISHHTFPPASDSTARDSIEAVRTRVTDLVATDPAILAVGIAVPGPYLPDTGHVGVITTMPTWSSINFRAEFEDAFSVPTFIEQDARAGVLAQSLFDTDSNTSSLAYYLLGEGIGLGVIENGQLVSGSRGGACEIGHISVDIDGLPCECGNRGCLERYCSATALREHLINSAPRLVPDAAHLSPTQAVESLCALAREGNEAAASLLHTAGTYIGYGCVTIMNAYNPRRIVLGDILAAAGDELLATVKAVARERVLPQIWESTTIELTHLPHDPILLGAAATATEQFLTDPARFLSK